MGFIGDAIGGIGDAVGGVLGDVPVVGDVLGAVGPAAGPLAGLIPGIGPLASTILGGLGGSQSGQAGEGAMGGFFGQQAAQTFRDARSDQERARELVNQAIGTSQEASDIARNQFQLDQPLRQQFRQGALSFGDPTNPFSTAAPQIPAGGHQFIQQPQAPQGPIQNPPPPTDVGGNVPQSGGTLSERINSIVNRGFDPGGGFQPVTQPSGGSGGDMRDDFTGGGRDARGGFGGAQIPNRDNILRSIQERFGGTPGFNPSAGMF